MVCAIQEGQRILTVDLMHTLSLVHERASGPFQKVKVKFVPLVV